jgi:protein-disulfide isomerase
LSFTPRYQGLYLPFHNHLMRAGLHDEASLRTALAESGGDWARLEADLARHADAIEALLATSARDALQLGLRGTPGFLIGPIRIEGGASKRQFAEAIGRARRALDSPPAR